VSLAVLCFASLYCAIFVSGTGNSDSNGDTESGSKKVDLSAGDNITRT